MWADGRVKSLIDERAKVVELARGMTPAGSDSAFTSAGVTPHDNSTPILSAAQSYRGRFVE